MKKSKRPLIGSYPPSHFGLFGWLTGWLLSLRDWYSIWTGGGVLPSVRKIGGVSYVFIFLSPSATRANEWQFLSLFLSLSFSLSFYKSIPSPSSPPSPSSNSSQSHLPPRLPPNHHPPTTIPTPLIHIHTNQIVIPLKFLRTMFLPQMRNQTIHTPTQTIAISKSITKHTREFASLRRMAFCNKARVEAVVFCSTTMVIIIIV